MSNEHNQQTMAENKLADAISQLRKEPIVEIEPHKEESIDVQIDNPEQKKEPRRSEFVQTDDPKVLNQMIEKFDQGFDVVALVYFDGQRRLLDILVLVGDAFARHAHPIVSCWQLRYFEGAVFRVSLG